MWSEQESVGDSSLLLAGRGMDTLGRVLICSLPCSWLKAVLLYIMGSLGLSDLVDVVEEALQGELMLELSLSRVTGLTGGVTGWWCLCGHGAMAHCVMKLQCVGCRRWLVEWLMITQVALVY